MIERYLSIIEVSQKQAYIFGSNKLAENIRRSAEIRWLTEPEQIQELFEQTSSQRDKKIFDAQSNTVYAGGGHTVLTFDTFDEVREFHRRYSFMLRVMNPDIEVFVFSLPYCSRVSARQMLDYVCNVKERSQERDEKFAESAVLKGTSKQENCAPGSYLKELVRGLERKKSLRRASFRQGSFGIEVIDANTRSVKSGKQRTDSARGKGAHPEDIFVWRSDYNGKPLSGEEQIRRSAVYERLKMLNSKVEGTSPVPEKYASASKFENLGGTKGDVNFLAVVHIDGNGMGARCNDYYESLRKRNTEAELTETVGNEETTSWDDFRKSVKKFSEEIDGDFKEALKNMFSRVGRSIEEGKLQGLSLKSDSGTGKMFFPIRGIIASGDDICFVTDGRIGIECASIFLEELAALTNNSDGKKYSASAGVAIVHQKYPFFRAYELAESLCSNAKQFAAGIRLKQQERYQRKNAPEAIVPMVLKDNGAGICAIDWHLEMGEIGVSLEEIRENYLTKDTVDGKHRHLEMRPYIVTAVSGLEENAQEEVKKLEPHRQFDAFRKQMTSYLKSESDEDLHSKLKELRGILKRGETEAQYYIRFHKLKGLVVDSYYGIFRDIDLHRNPEEIPLYVSTADGESRSVIFDAAEALDTYFLI